MLHIIAKYNDQEITELPSDLYINPQALQIFLEMFEGPLDLLLYLIRKQNLDILSIPIAKITDQYISYINAMQVLNIDLAAEYLLMAAMLLEIKSRMLLPKPKVLENEDDLDIDPKQELIRKLIEYEKIKIAGQELAKIPSANNDYKWINVLLNDSSHSFPDVNLNDLKSAWQNILLKSLMSHKKHLIKRDGLSVRQHMSEILRTLNNLKSTTFFKLFNPTLGIAHVIVNFIAILELTKEGLVKLSTETHNEITVTLSNT